MKFFFIAFIFLSFVIQSHDNHPDRYKKLPLFPLISGVSNKQKDLTSYTQDVVQLSKQFIALTPDSQKKDLIKPFNSPDRTKGTDTTSTPSFCAVLSWCKGWGIPQCSMNNVQRTVMHQMFSIALSSGGYQTFLAVLNRQRVIGEMEEVATKKAVQDAKKQYPSSRESSIFKFSQFAPVPLDRWYPVIGGVLKPQFPDQLILNWVWNPPGLTTRYKDFCDYSLVFFGNPGDSKWSIRFEGHHISINLVFVQNEKGLNLHVTPLFIGAFPMIIPENVSLYSNQPTIKQQWKWTEGQVMMFSSTYHIRKFWNSLSENNRDKAFIGPSAFVQDSPLVLDTPPPFLVSGLDTKVDKSKILKYPHIKVSSLSLSQESLWHLKQAFFFYIKMAHPTVADIYSLNLNSKLSSGVTLYLSWAGGKNIFDFSNHHYSYLQIDNFLLEYLQSNQFSVQHDKSITGNHVHSIFRDLSFDWTNPMSSHHIDSHMMKQ